MYSGGISHFVASCFACLIHYSHAPPIDIIFNDITETWVSSKSPMLDGVINFV